MEFKAPEIINIAVTGILGLLWWDIRTIRKDRDGEAGKQQSQREGDLNQAYETFLKKEDHAVLCENAALRIERSVGAMLKDAVVELKSEIKKNGNTDA